MISWQDLISRYRAPPPFVKASLAISAVSLSFLLPYHMGESVGVAAYYFFNS
ncbi:hypothetical protein [Massilia sp. CFBP9026]|uniref:hypothetical protein n=1 Tax=Massilia sp. CFBP9026 TaxID=3096536 RepID=UPI002A6B3873|nr:hypothetical protein [Massilia sp. CFBP9026]MDY0965076.1 hypothetical protein [Massilia sp. CFBP9026]